MMPTDHERAISFGAAASDYHQYRPGYSDAVFDAVLAYATKPVRRALEIGAGTGKATLGFIHRGIHVTAIEPDLAMRQHLHRVTVGLPSRIVPRTFEQHNIDDRFDLVFSAQAWHWTIPETRWSILESLILNDGVFCVITNDFQINDPDLRDRIEEVHWGIVPSIAEQSRWVNDDDPSARWPFTEMQQSSILTDLRCVVQTSCWHRTPSEYIGFLGSQSLYRLLHSETQQSLFESLHGVLPSSGFQLTVQTSLFLATACGSRD